MTPGEVAAFRAAGVHDDFRRVPESDGFEIKPARCEVRISDADFERAARATSIADQVRWMLDRAVKKDMYR